MIKIKKAGLGQRVGDAVLNTFVRYPRITGAVGLGSVNAGIGYVQGKMDEKFNKQEVKQNPLLKAKPRAIIYGAIGAAGGAWAGHKWRTANAPFYASGAHKNYNAKAARETAKASRDAQASGNWEDYAKKQWEQRAAAASTEHVPTPKWAKGARTKADAKKRYHAEAMRHHPDRGGSSEKMKTINTEWEKWEKSPGFQKLSHVLASLIDELEKLGVKLPSSLTAPPPHLTPIVQQPKTPVRGRMQVPMQQPPDASAVGPQSTDPKV